MHVHLDPLGGVAGDMFAAALLDACPQQAEPLAAGLAASRLHEIVAVRTEPFTDGVLRGLRFHTRAAAGPEGGLPGRGPPHAGGEPHVPPPGHGHPPHRHHDHRRFADVRAWLGRSRLPPPVAERAAAIFTVLAEAEAQVHGIAVADVTFHEVGAWDSIADVVCAAWLIDSLDPVSWSSAPLPLGGGRVTTAHGALPVPAPATALLLEGMPVHHDGVGGERVTPTGAAILRHLDPAFELAGIEGRLTRTGHGFGTRRLAGMSNVLRALVLDTADPGHRPWRDETVEVCTFEVDDQTGEDLAVGIERLRACDGVLDAVQTPVLGKKGRMAASVRIIHRPAARTRVIERCFAETSTLGVRSQSVRRATLAREEAAAEVAGDRIRVKRAERPGGGATVKAEMEDVARAGGGRAAREARRRQAESE